MIRALAESARISNLPTVWTNVLVGAVLGGWSDESAPLTAALLAGSLFYLGGMLLNDVVDAKWDRQHNRQRPVADGRLPRSTAMWIGLFGLFAGLILAASRPVPGRLILVLVALALVVCILLYNWLHKRSAWAALFMAGCRALLYPLAALMISADPADTFWPASAAIGAYTLLLTLAARKEDQAGASVSRFVAWIVPLPFLAAAVAYSAEHLLWVVLAGVLFLGWSAVVTLAAVRGRLRFAVMGWIAGLCLADAFLLALLDRPALACLAVSGWLVTVLAHRRISGT